MHKLYVWALFRTQVLHVMMCIQFYLLLVSALRLCNSSFRRSEGEMRASVSTVNWRGRRERMREMERGEEEGEKGREG